MSAFLSQKLCEGFSTASMENYLYVKPLDIVQQQLLSELHFKNLEVRLNW